ncbi:MAG: glutathione S-transferase family protein [Rhodospirillaceae bacterium]
MYTLHHCPGSCSTAPHILLEECGADYDTRLVVLSKGEQRTEAYRKINPHGKVPALAVGDRIITQNPAILQFIASQFPDAGLAPPDPLDLARCMEIAGWLSSAAHPAYGLARHPERPAGAACLDEAAVEAIRDNGRKLFWGCLEEIESRLSGSAWMMGHRYSYLDPYALVFFGWGVQLEMPMNELGNFTSFRDRMLARPAVHRVLEREQSPLLGAV